MKKPKKIMTKHNTHNLRIKSRYNSFMIFVIFGVFSLLISNTSIADDTNLSEPLKKGVTLFEAGDYLAANKLFSIEVEKNADDARALQLLGMSYYKLQNNKQAIQSLEKSIEIDPETADSYYALGISYLARTGDVSILKVRKTLKNAISYLNKAIELDPNHARAKFYLIQVLINAPSIMGGDTEKGLELNNQLAKNAPLQHIVVNSTLAIKEENYGKAEEILLSADKQFPNKTMVAYSLGELYLLLEDYSKALDYGKKFLSGSKLWDETSESSGYYLLARAYKGQNNKAESQKYYGLVLDNTKSKRLRKQVERELDELDGKALPDDEKNISQEFTEEQLNDPDFLDSLSKEESM